VVDGVVWAGAGVVTVSVTVTGITDDVRDEPHAATMIALATPRQKMRNLRIQ
jgi:hypothetical protein